MKVCSLQFIFGLALFAVVCFGCSKADDSGGGGGGIFIPDLANTWTNKADATNTFFFLVDSAGKKTSTFTGNENPSGGGAQLHFSGSYTNRSIQFTYDAGSSKSGKSYTGTINDSSNVMTLSSSQLGSLVLEKK